MHYGRRADALFSVLGSAPIVLLKLLVLIVTENKERNATAMNIDEIERL